MKTKNDPRHQLRIQTVKELFAHSFTLQKVQSEQTQAVIAKMDQIDAEIAKNAPQWPIDKISKIDLAILRPAAYELIIVQKEPPKVIIDEAVEIAKEFGSESSPKFVNGVLGTLLSKLQMVPMALRHRDPDRSIGTNSK